MKKIWGLTLAILLWLVGMAWAGQSVSCGIGYGPCINVTGQGSVISNSQTTGAANTAVVVTLAAVGQTSWRIQSVDAWCSAGTSSITITDGGTQIWSTVAAEVTTAHLRYTWPVSLTGQRSNAVVITLATCGVGNTGTLAVQADRF